VIRKSIPLWSALRLAVSMFLWGMCGGMALGVELRHQALPTVVLSTLALGLTFYESMQRQKELPP
jgi:hypothetical protein